MKAQDVWALESTRVQYVNVPDLAMQANFHLKSPVLKIFVFMAWRGKRKTAFKMKIDVCFPF